MAHRLVLIRDTLCCLLWKLDSGWEVMCCGRQGEGRVWRHGHKPCTRGEVPQGRAGSGFSPSEDTLVAPLGQLLWEGTVSLVAGLGFRQATAAQRPGLLAQAPGGGNAPSPGPGRLAPPLVKGKAFLSIIYPWWAAF